MTPKQETLYWREWGKTRARLISDGLTSGQAAAKRHSLHIKALGRDQRPRHRLHHRARRRRNHRALLLPRISRRPRLPPRPRQIRALGDMSGRLRTYNHARQADWHERALYGHKPNKLDRDRFAGETTAAAGPLDTLDAADVRKRHITMASRHQRKTRGQKTEARKPKPPSVPPPKSPDPVPASTSDEADWPF